MLLPEFLYGTNSEAKKKCRKMANKIIKGMPWEKLYETEMIDTDKNNAMFYDGHPNDVYPDIEYFFIGLFIDYIDNHNKCTNDVRLQNQDFFQDIDRGSGVYIIVFKEGKPDEIFFGGYSFD